MYTAQPPPFLSNPVSATQGSRVSNGPLQGAGKPGSGQRLGAAGFFISHLPASGQLQFQWGPRSPASAGEGKGREKEEVEGAPGRRGCRASLPRSVALALPSQIASPGKIKERPWSARGSGQGTLTTEAIVKVGEPTVRPWLGENTRLLRGPRAPGTTCVLGRRAAWLPAVPASPHPQVAWPVFPLFRRIPSSTPLAAPGYVCGEKVPASVLGRSRPPPGKGGAGVARRHASLSHRKQSHRPTKALPPSPKTRSIDTIRRRTTKEIGGQGLEASP